MSRHKAPNGCGTLIKRKNGLLEARVWVPMSGGKRKRVSKYFKKRREGQEWLVEMRCKASNNELTLESSVHMEDYLRRWLQDFCINIRPSTVGNYIQYLRHIQSHPVGKTPLCKLTTFDLQSLIRDLLDHGRLDGKGGLSGKTVRNLMLMIHQALKQAVGCRFIAQNPADYIVLPKVNAKKIDVLSVEELRQLISASQHEPWGISVLLLAVTGIRVGELLALRHDSIVAQNDFVYLEIRASYQRVPNLNGNGTAKTVMQIGPPKTMNGIRQIPLAPEAAELLRLHLQRQEKLSAESYGVYKDNPFVISDELGNPIEPSRYRKWFGRMVSKAGIERRVYPHLLRHTWASLALEADVDLKNLSDVLGHFDTAFSCRRYVHPNLEARAAALSKMEETVHKIISDHSGASASL